MLSMICPYCKESVYSYKECKCEGIVHTLECEECGKYFVYRVTYYVECKTQIAPCLNGEEHRWEKNIDSPGYLVCKWCGAEKRLPAQRLTHEGDGRCQ